MTSDEMYLPLLQSHVTGYVAVAVECFRVSENDRVEQPIVRELFRYADECAVYISNNKDFRESWYKSYKDGDKELSRMLFWAPTTDPHVSGISGIIDAEQMTLVLLNKPAYLTEWGVPYVYNS